MVPVRENKKNEARLVMTWYMHRSSLAGMSVYSYTRAPYVSGGASPVPIFPLFVICWSLGIDVVLLKVYGIFDKLSYQLS
jgi:hypothetical protein